MIQRCGVTPLPCAEAYIDHLLSGPLKDVGLRQRLANGEAAVRPCGCHEESCLGWQMVFGVATVARFDADQLVHDVDGGYDPSHGGSCSHTSLR